jgi:hypothetical protein
MRPRLTLLLGNRSQSVVQKIINIQGYFKRWNAFHGSIHTSNNQMKGDWGGLGRELISHLEEEERWHLAQHSHHSSAGGGTIGGASREEEETRKEEALPSPPLPPDASLVAAAFFFRELENERSCWVRVPGLLMAIAGKYFPTLGPSIYSALCSAGAADFALEAKQHVDKNRDLRSCAKIHPCRLILISMEASRNLPQTGSKTPPYNSHTIPPFSFL